MMGLANPFSVGRRGGASPIDAAYESASRVASGRAAPGATVVVKVNGSIVAAIVADAQGAWAHPLASDPDGARVTVEVVVATPEIVTPRALPSLPLPVGARFAAIGDSIIGYANYGGAPVSSTAKAVDTMMYSYLEHARTLDQRWNFDSWFDLNDPTKRNISGANQGMFGDHMDWNNPAFLNGIIPRLRAILARRPHLLLLEGGSNTISSGDIAGDGRPGNPHYVIAKLEEGLVLARYAGVPVILSIILPRNDWPDGDARHESVKTVNAWVRKQATREGVVGILDPYADLIGPDGKVLPEMFMGDRVHLNHRGGFKVAKEHLLPILQRVIQPGSVYSKDLTVANMLPIATAKLQGTNGAKLNAATGTVAGGFLVNGNRNVSAVCSKEVVSGDVEAQVIDITVAQNNAAAFWQVDVQGPAQTIPFVNGKFYQVIWKMETSGTDTLATARCTIAARTVAGNVTQLTCTTMQGFSGEFGIPVDGAPRTAWIASNPFQIPDGVVVDRLQLAWSLYGAKQVGTSMKLKMSNLILREVPDPRPVWGYAT